jgi:hypothetical protein
MESCYATIQRFIFDTRFCVLKIERLSADGFCLRMTMNIYPVFN